MRAASLAGMKRKLSILFVIFPLLASAGEKDNARRAADLNQRSFVFDAHCDTILSMLKEGRDLGKRNKAGHIDIPRMIEGGLNAQVFALWVEPDHWPDHAAHRTLVMLDALLNAVNKYPGRLSLALSAADARKAYKEGKIAVFIGIEGGHAIEDDLAVLRMFHRLGVRLMTLTWMKNTNWADGSGDDPEHGGLTPFGEKVVREMNRLGMVIDLSHVSDETFYDALKITNKPVVVSHSCCRSPCDHHRNPTDAMLKALAKNGGVIGINFFSAFLDPEVNKLSTRLWARIEKLWQKHEKDPATYQKLKKPLVDEYKKKVPEVPIERLIDHIDHVVDVAGIDHVGLGSDFDGMSLTPRGLDDVSKLPLITEKLLERGYSEEDIAKILGGNLLRVFETACD